MRTESESIPQLVAEAREKGAADAQTMLAEIRKQESGCSVRTREQVAHHETIAANFGRGVLKQIERQIRIARNSGNVTEWSGYEYLNTIATALIEGTDGPEETDES